METEVEILRRELAEARALNEALRTGQVDAVVGEKAVSMVRLHEVEQELHERQKELEEKNTELRKAYETLRNRSLELERTNDELKEFTYAVSHDLRTPLHTISSFAEILQEDYEEKLDEEGRMLLEKMLAEAERMNTLINETLDLSRVSRMEVVRSTVDLSAMAKRIMDRYRQAEPHREAEVAILPGLVARCDERLMERVLENLLSNAWKYTGRKNKTVIVFTAESKEGKTVYAVRDNGAGFSMEHAKRLFTPFQRLHAEKEFSGTGVGLSIVQRIIHRHGGRIWAESDEGRGASFYFTLE
ncbi:MAG: hypothetical protein GF344_03770 [Chitinivibrionales bacterium]|nr:hypothetical protein [Chitinivibrionales bacterium]MBD3356174.1 hypothetical protein [Chitinivibrionales bacterium]